MIGSIRLLSFPPASIVLETRATSAGALGCVDRRALLASVVVVGPIYAISKK